MDKKEISNFRFFVLFLIFFVSFFISIPFLGAQSPASHQCLNYPEPEAKAWLGDPQRQIPFAKRRFGDVEEALRLIDKLYTAGAIYVGIVYVMGEADALKIYLPFKPEKREAIFKIADRELARSGYRREDDHGQYELTIWF